ncbi:hypothetical protein BGY98DRAFT_605312 [Russula aff. rugulosa BPL654]|nr:hypothetical protein BGY98DRAFT_605312 [Russula aff. rugulosa BPL654]
MCRRMAIARLFLFLSIVNFTLAAPVVLRGVHEVHANVVDVAEDGTATSQNWWDVWLAKAVGQTSVPTTQRLPDLDHPGLHNTRSNNVPSSSALLTGPRPRSKDDFPPGLGSPNYSPIQRVPDQSFTSTGNSNPDNSPSRPDNSLPSPTHNPHLSNPDGFWPSWLSLPNWLPPSLHNPLPSTAPTADNSHLSNSDDVWPSWLSLHNFPTSSPDNPSALTSDNSNPHPLNPDHPPPSGPSPADDSHPSNPDDAWLGWLSLDKSPTPSPDNSPTSQTDNSHPSTSDDFWPSRLSADNSFPSSADNSPPGSTDKFHSSNPDDFWPSRLLADNSHPSGQDGSHSLTTPSSSSPKYSSPSSWSPEFSPPSSWSTDYSPPSSSPTDHSPMSIDYSPPSSWSTDHPLPSPLTSTPGYSAPNSWLADKSHSPSSSSPEFKFSPPSSWSTDYSPPSSSSTDHSQTSIDYSPPSSWLTGHPLPSPLTSTPGHSASNSWIADKSHSPSLWLPKYSPPSRPSTDYPLRLPLKLTTESLTGPHQYTNGHPPPGLEPLSPAMSTSSSESEDFLDKLLRGKIRRRISGSGAVGLAQSEVRAVSALGRRSLSPLSTAMGCHS